MALPFSLDNPTSYVYNNGSNVVRESYAYNSDHQLVFKAVTANGETKTYTYSYKDDTAKSLDSISLGSYKFSPKTDCLSRNRGKTISVSKSKIAEEQITYLKYGDHATNIPATIYYGDMKNGRYAFSDHFKYKYDSMGNIAEIRENGELYARYAYDTIGRLVREDNKKLGKTVTFTYDTNGNILCRKEYAFTLIEAEKLDELEYTTFAYAYDGDKLLSYNGEDCVYDTIGNPTTYRDIKAVWENGRQLKKLGANTFTYDNLGRRIGKNSITFTYDSNGNLIHQSNGISFIYDASGVCGITHNNNTYFYRKDILGNIIALLNTNGEIVANYTYDTWGKHTVTDANGNVITDEDHIACLNPFRYRGYYYDTETKLYYLQTRYYDPETGRFITIDDISYLAPDSINGLNLYAYCRNNPVMYVDPSGNFLFLTLLIATFAGAAISGGINMVSQLSKNGWSFSELDWGSIVNSTIVGGVLGLSMAMGVGFLGPVLAGVSGASTTSAVLAFGASTVISFTGGAMGYATQEWMNGRTPSFGTAMKHGTAVALEGIIKFHAGGTLGSFGSIGTKGTMFSTEWITKVLIGQILTSPAKILLDYIRNLS